MAQNGKKQHKHKKTIKLSQLQMLSTLHHYLRNYSKVNPKRGAPAEWFKGGHQVLAKNAIFGGISQFFSI